MRATPADVRVLGPIEVGERGPVAIQALKERRLLAALLVDAGATRSSDALMDALWGEAVPRSAPKLLQLYVSKLRKVLPASVRIATRGPGYALEVADGVLDAVRFERLLGEGRESASVGNLVLAASLFRRALALWRGPAYGEFASEDFARAEAERLEELRLEALEERNEAELALGHHLELVAEFLSLANTHPLRERIQGQAMVALYRCGRQSEALDLYLATDRRLRDELGVEPGVELRELHRLIVRQDPALATPRAAERAPGSPLPTPPGLLFGRERELEDLGEFLARDDVRLLSLTGAGGSGKTRLALEAAHRAAPTFANGAAFVGLASLHDPGLLPAAIASALGIERPGGEPLENLAGALGSRELLLVLDNLEHLRRGTPILTELLSRAPRLRLLVTSRVVLHLSGEHVYPVEPLEQDPALALFLMRARGANARFDQGAAGEEVIARICERLDRLPLAIELAAGRVRSLTPAEILHRLDRRLPLLTGGPRDLPARQRTLRATIEWSVNLLEEQERRDLIALSVFAGGCTLSAAEDVSSTTLERISSLVDHNLLLHEVTSDGSRYSMLETIREYASGLLKVSGRAEEIRRRHAGHMLTVAESLGLSGDDIGYGVPQRFDLARVEQDNLRTALDWALEHDPEVGLRLAVALEQFWVSANPREGMRRFEALLARANDAAPGLRARALRDLGGSTEIAGDWERAEQHYTRSLELYEELGDEGGVINLRFRLANTRTWARDLAAARDLLENALDRAVRGGHTVREPEILNALSYVEFLDGNVEEAYRLQRQGLDRCREQGGWPWGEANMLMNLAEFSTKLGRTDEGEAYGREALEVSRTVGDLRKTVYSLAALAIVARAQGDAERAGTLWGAIETAEERAFLGTWSTDGEEYARQVLEPADAELERGLVAGRRMTLEQAVTFALGAG
jgi:predicted ATPase/DNA-binding SARP family transcriptional activator